VPGVCSRCARLRLPRMPGYARGRQAQERKRTRRSQRKPQAPTGGAPGDGTGGDPRPSVIDVLLEHCCVLSPDSALTAQTPLCRAERVGSRMAFFLVTVGLRCRLSASFRRDFSPARFSSSRGFVILPSFSSRGSFSGASRRLLYVYSVCVTVACALPCRV
jgi:hypothetical protein